MLSRSVKKTYPINDSAESYKSLTFTEILDVPHIVLLGEPGAGKTYLFKSASSYENGNFIPARSFVFNADDAYTNKPVYIDALDEKRSRLDQPDSIGEIITKIRQIKPSKVRLSCRASDWLGETDLELFKPYFEANGGYCVVLLEALTEAEIDQILTDKSIANPSEFKEKAQEKGVGTLLSNPQTLIMLADLVNSGQWPSSKKELYENAADLLLTEHNDKHKRKPLAAYKPEQLKDAAGAACAVLLIADVEGISLLNHGNYPYADIPYSDADTVLAALTKQAFVTTDRQQEKVNYSHRTIAEYLAARWLIKSIRNGLSVSRVISWLGIDNHPVLELRGLFAWLVQLLPEHAAALMRNDPYGVLILGDVSCLSLSNRKVLLNALVNLTEKDPWFRAQDWTSEPLGTLSTPEMANEFKTILAKEPRQFHLRSIVLNIIQYGEQQPELKDDLLQLFCDTNAHFAERADAFFGLINAVPDGKSLVVKATKENLKTTSDDLRLKEDVIAKLYEGHFTALDVIQLIKDHTESNNRSVGDIWVLGRALPLDALPEILDRLTELELNESGDDHESWCFIYEALERTLHGNNDIDINRLWLWISKLNFASSYGSYRNEDLVKDWLDNNPQHVIGFFNIALLELNDFSSIWSFWNSFQQKTRYAFDINQIIDFAFSLIADKNNCDQKDQFIFELILCLTIYNVKNIRLFEFLVDFGNAHPELADILVRSCQSEVHEWRWKDAIRKTNKAIKQKENIQNNRQDFQKNKKLIRTGQHLGWMEWLANVYFAKFCDVDQTQTAYQRLEKQLGEHNAEIALEGLQAVLNRNDLPTLSMIAIASSKSQYPTWWFAILAGMSEHWHRQNNLNTCPENTLKTTLALNLLFSPFYISVGNTHTQITPDWQTAIFQQNSELVQTTYLEVIETLLATRKEYIPGVRDICEHALLVNNRAQIVLHLLTKFPNATIQELETLLLTAIKLPEIKNEILALTQAVLNPYTKMRLKQKALWLSVGFLLDFDKFKDGVSYAIKKYKLFVWTLIRVIGRVGTERGNTLPISLSADQLEGVIRLVGYQYPDVGYPNGIMEGSQNPWDAADFIKKQINQLSARIDSESVRVLHALIHEPSLSSYHDHLKHAAANQAALRRKQQFIQPNWQQTIAALSNGKPAHIADLHALTIEHLKDVSHRIRTENTDIFKVFWNEDSYGRITDKPKSEESCRDRLIDLLRPKFTPLDINVEPEGHMVLDKRADIVLLHSAKQKLPIEIKRHYHLDLWSACENQLDRLYTRDPQAQDYGIYLVFWFGDKRSHARPKPPKSIQQPNTAQELEKALQSIINDQDRNRLAVVVIDVTRPDG